MTKATKKRHITQAVCCAVAVAAALLGSCSRGGVDAPALTAADSLLAAAPDSALALLEAMNPDTLGGDRTANRAYHALLTAQARFLTRAQPEPDDTTRIDGATEYYAGTPREARALIYAGTTREHLGDLTGAMQCYKQAEIAATAARDTFHTAYAQMMMGWLYQQQLMVPQTAIGKYRQACRLFERLADRRRVMICRHELGNLYASSGNDSALHYYERALQAAQQLNERNYVWRNYRGLAYYHFFAENDTLAYRYAMRAMEVADSQSMLQPRAIAMICGKRIGLPLPAADDVSELLRTGEVADSVLYYRVEAQKANIAGDVRRELVCSDSASLIAGTKLMSTQAEQLSHAEHKSETAHQLGSFARERTWYAAGALMMILCLAATFLWWHARSRKQERLIADLRKRVGQLRNKMENYRHMSEHVRSTLVHQRVVLTEIQDVINNTDDARRAATRVKGIIHRYRPDEQFWDELKEYINSHFRNIVSDLTAKYPKMTENYVRVLCLACCGCSTVEMMSLTGLASCNVVNNYKSAITRKIMRVDYTLADLIENYREEESFAGPDQPTESPD